MKITTWNVNYVRARLDHVTAWLKENRPDFLCLQETKSMVELYKSQSRASVLGE